MTLPDWLTPLPDAAQQRALDAWAIEHGIPSATLMERAGTALADAVQELVPEGRIVILCGGGNNGGDGHVAARVLHERGRDVAAIDVTKDQADLSPAALAGAAGIVDALLGTGFSGEPRSPVSDAIETINAAAQAASNVKVIACDVPSGVDASTGEVASIAVQADVTVTFHAAKPGLLIAPGKRHSGRIRVIDIGIPAEGQPVEPEIGRIGPAVRDQIPSRAAASTKFSSGSVLVVGGSRGLTGAPVLASTAAARAGAGYVTVAVPASVYPIVAGKLLEVMAVELADDPDSGLRRGTSRAVVERAARSGALVLDADGLNAHAEEGGLESLTERKAPTILTPHVGELARLLRVENGEVDAHRLKSVLEAARRSGAVVVLKGDDTLVATPDGRVAVSPGDAPALATAGTGDVLSGITGAFLAKGVDPFTAACAAVMIHVKAGRIAAREVGSEGVIASDVIAALPKALSGPRRAGRGER